MVGLAIASGCIEDVYPRILAHIAIFVCPLRFAHFGPKFLEFGGFSWLLETRRLRNALRENYWGAISQEEDNACTYCKSLESIYGHIYTDRRNYYYTRGARSRLNR